MREVWTARVRGDAGRFERATLLVDDEPKRPRYRQRRRLIADEVEARLREAGMADTWQGAAALDLADALDWYRAGLPAWRELRALPPVAAGQP